jgi:hypothetical protein
MLDTFRDSSASLPYQELKLFTLKRGTTVTHEFASGHKRPPTWQAGYLRGGMSKMQPTEMAQEAQFSRSTNAFWGLRPQRLSLYVVFIRPLTASARSPMNNPIFSSSFA